MIHGSFTPKYRKRLSLFHKILNQGNVGSTSTTALIQSDEQVLFEENLL
jgi:hypothetical protein